MAEIRSKSNEDHLKRLDKEVTDLGVAYKSTDQVLKVMSTKQDRMEQMMGEMNQKYDSIVAILAQMNGSKANRNGKQIEGSAVPSQNSGDNIHGSEFPTGSSSGGREFKMFSKLPKIDFPYFGGEGPREWLRKAKYFQIHQIEDEMRVAIAEMYLKGKADIWFHGFISSHPHTDWDLFSREICRRFAENTAEEVIEVFSKLRQKGSMLEYQEQFEELKSQVMISLPHLPESYYISIFISGLKEEIKSMVKIIQPQTLAKAFEIAILQENTITALSRNSKSFNPYPTHKGTNPTSKLNEPTPKPTPYTEQRNTTNSLRFETITPSDFQTKRELGLCYKCDEKYTRGHICKNRMLNFILIDEEKEVVEESPGDEEEQVDKRGVDELMEISLWALMGSNRGKTIRLPGLIKGKKVSILIDSGSSRSFIDEQLVSSIGCSIQTVKPASVTVAGGGKLISKAICNPLTWKMKDLEFQYQLRVLKLGESDMVLGVDWLSQFSPVLFDFIKGSITFSHEGFRMELQDETFKEGFQVLNDNEGKGIEKEKELSVVRVSKLEENNTDVRNKMERKENEIRGLEKKGEKSTSQNERVNGRNNPFKVLRYRKVSVSCMKRNQEDEMNEAYVTLHYLLNPRVVKRMIQVERISILIDSGSTHRFLDEKLVQELRCKIQTVITDVDDDNGGVEHGDTTGGIKPDTVYSIHIHGQREQSCHHSVAVTPWLVQWKGYNPDDVTWADAENIQASFPSFQPWGQVEAKGEGCYSGGNQLNWGTKGRRNTRKTSFSREEEIIPPSSIQARDDIVSN